MKFWTICVDVGLLASICHFAFSHTFEGPRGSLAEFPSTGVPGGLNNIAQQCALSDANRLRAGLQSVAQGADAYIYPGEGMLLLNDHGSNMNAQERNEIQMIHQWNGKGLSCRPHLATANHDRNSSKIA